MNILIIGLGAIGKRHLEGAMRFNHELNIYIYDIKFDNTFNSNKIIRVANLNHLNAFSSQFDLVIVSTTVNERFAICKKIIKLVKIKNLILEKFVFRNINQFNTFDKIIKEKKINTYINCPRRNYNIYKYLKKNFIKNKNKIINIEINYSNFGILSNSIHIIDLLFYLIGKKIKLKKINISSFKIIKTKRKLYSDISGLIKFYFHDNESTITISDSLKKNNFKICSTNKIFKILEAKNSIVSDKIIKFNDDIYQSNLTSKYIYSLYKNQKINLPTYESLLQVQKFYISYLRRNKKFANINFT